MRTVLVASTVVLAACATTTDEPSAVAGWRAPADYEFVLDSRCGERNFLGRYHIVVQDGEVTGVTDLADGMRGTPNRKGAS